jgi:5-methylcytosine-specific restriction protein A
VRWRRLRAAQLRDDPFCAWPDCDRFAEQVDHVIALALGGAKWERANLQSLCRRHHEIKTANDSVIARQRRRSTS